VGKGVHGAAHFDQPALRILASAGHDFFGRGAKMPTFRLKRALALGLGAWPHRGHDDRRCRVTRPRGRGTLQSGRREKRGRGESEDGRPSLRRSMSRRMTEGSAEWERKQRKQACERERGWRPHAGWTVRSKGVSLLGVLLCAQRPLLKSPLMIVTMDMSTRHTKTKLLDKQRHFFL